MIHVKVGKPSYSWSEELVPGLRVTEVGANTDIMLQHVYNQDAFMINNAHMQPNICLFAKLCKEKNKLVLICGNINLHTRGLLDIADTFEKI